MTTEVFPIAPGHVRMIWVIIPLLLVIVAVGGVLAYSAAGARVARFEVSPAGLRLRGDFYGRLIPAAELRVDEARVVDLRRERTLQPTVRTGGTALPGYSAGWFRLRDGERALLYLTDHARVAYVPTTAGYAVLLSVADPAALVASLRRAFPSIPPLMRFMRRPLLAAGTSLALLLGARVALAQPTVVIVVRHAEKAAAPANDPPLTAAGEARARALAEVLADANVQAVLSTPTLRTTSTAAPTAAARGLTTETVPATGGTPVHAAAVAAAIRQYHRGQTVLVVEHSNTVAAVVKALGGPALPDLCDGQYASLFTLVLGDGPDAGPPRLVRSTYGAADAPDAGSCVSVKK